MQKYGKLTALLLKEKKIATLILNFLNEAERISLIFTSQLLLNSFSEIYANFQKSKTEQILSKISQNKKNSLYFKINFPKHKKIIASIFFNKASQKISCPEPLSKFLPSKLTDLNFYSCFLNPQTKRYLFIPRSWLDKNLNFLKEEVQEKNPEMHKLIEQINLETAHIADSQAAFYARHKKLQNSLKQETKAQEDSDFDALAFFFAVKRFGIFLFQGGDFTFALYNDFKETVHGSEHKYVIRAKGGGKQSTKDKSKTIKSIGSQIRRENEKALLENIGEAIKKHSAEISECEVLFVFAPGLNLNGLVGFFEAAGIEKSLVRSIGFSSGKAKYLELKKIFDRLTTLYVV